MSQWLPQDQIHDTFSRVMSEMYRQEVPQYGTLIELVETINRETQGNRTSRLVRN